MVKSYHDERGRLVESTLAIDASAEIGSLQDLVPRPLDMMLRGQSPWALKPITSASLTLYGTRVNLLVDTGLPVWYNRGMKGNKMMKSPNALEMFILGVKVVLAQVSLAWR